MFPARWHSTHTGPVGAPPAPSRALCPEDTQDAREGMPGKGCQGRHSSTAVASVLGSTWADHQRASASILDAKPISTCTPQPSERPRCASDSGFIFTGQHKMKCEEVDKCTEHGAMVTSDIRSLAEQTAAGMISVYTELLNYVSCVSIKRDAIGFHRHRRCLVFALPAWRCLNELFCSAQWWHCFHSDFSDHNNSALTPKKRIGIELAETVTLPYRSKPNKMCQKEFSFSLSRGKYTIYLA